MNIFKATIVAIAATTIPLAAPIAALAEELPTVPVLEEDQPGWDCRTMGNKICGPGNVDPSGVPILPGDYSTGSALIRPVASPKEDQAAIGQFTTVLGAASAAGTLSGTIAGAVLGCGAGAVLGLPLAIVPGAIGGCLAGAAIGAPIGAVVGTVVVGGPTLAIAGGDLISTLTAQPGTTRWAEPQGGIR